MWTISLLLAAATIACDAPGAGPKALAGFRTSVGLVQALGEYRAKFGGYPENLEALSPQFLAHSQLAPPPGVSRIRYKRSANGFELEFEYHGPGVNRCHFESAKREWTCDGHY
jgi:hypothetical protein